MNIDLTKLMTNIEDETVINENFELDESFFKNTPIRALKNT